MIAAANPSKKRRSEQTSDIESVNSIAQRLSEMSSPLSFKRLRPSCSDMGDSISAQDMNLDSVAVPEENTPCKLHGDHVLQTSSQRWLINVDNKQEMMQQIQAWPNVACGNNFQASHPFLASSYGGQVFGPGF